jgi:hypothetical protein
MIGGINAENCKEANHKVVTNEDKMKRIKKKKHQKCTNKPGRRLPRAAAFSDEMWVSSMSRSAVSTTFSVASQGAILGGKIPDVKMDVCSESATMPDAAKATWFGLEASGLGLPSECGSCADAGSCGEPDIYCSVTIQLAKFAPV